eukprot:scaffold42304_cov62-Phaeocystis_antarctica.AAC.1
MARGGAKACGGGAAARCAGVGCLAARPRHARATSDVLRGAVCARRAAGTAGVAGGGASATACVSCITITSTAGSIIESAAAVPILVGVATTVPSTTVAVIAMIPDGVRWRVAVCRVAAV